VGEFQLDGYQGAINYMVRFNEAGYPTLIYFRKGVYRTVIPGYRTEAQAGAALPGVQQINPSAYLRELSVWCPLPVLEGEYIICH
jgi:hypothetical protein